MRLALKAVNRPVGPKKKAPLMRGFFILYVMRLRVRDLLHHTAFQVRGFFLVDHVVLRQTIDHARDNWVTIFHLFLLGHRAKFAKCVTHCFVVVTVA